MEELLQNFATYLVAIGPALASCIGAVVSIITAIKKCKEVSEDSLKETKEIKTSTNAMISQMKSVLEENTTLKEKVIEVTNAYAQQNSYLQLENNKLNEEIALLKEQQNLIEEMKKENEILKAQQTAILNKLNEE